VDAQDAIEIVQLGGELGDRPLSADFEVNRDVARIAVVGTVVVVLDLEVGDRESTLRALREGRTQEPAASR
jgi:hypothetical protein